MEDPECKCSDEIEEHTCPYAEEINDDSEKMCKCCEGCINQCLMEI